MAYRHGKHRRQDRRLRRLHVESLEDRRMLVVATVTTHLDVVDFGDGVTSLREAIFAANTLAGADEINFDASLDGATITLGGTQLVIEEALVIDARPLAANVTIDANELSRIFNITATTGDFTLGGLTLTGGRTTANRSTGFGGAIRSLTTGNLTLDQSTVSGNSTVGIFAYGGGISAKGTVMLTQSTVSGNSTSGNFAHGGGIYAKGTVMLTQSTASGNSTAGQDASGGGVFSNGAVTLTQSTVTGNSTTGSLAHGGGIQARGTVTLTESTVSGNSTSGYFALGGGISAFGAVTLTQSTVSGNSTAGQDARGGGVFASGAVTLTQSTVSGNSTSGYFALGGGIYAYGAVTLTQSTVSGNSTAGQDASGGGVFASGAVTLTQSTVTGNFAIYAAGGGVFQYNLGFNHPFSISGSIVAGNTAGGGGTDLVKDPQSMLTISYSLIGDNASTGLTEAQTPDLNGNLIGSAAGAGIISPMLDVLADNGGPTYTHALLLGSPAIDAGDPSFAPPPDTDQRGEFFARVFGGRIDIGAYEAQPPDADFDGDHDVDGSDFLAWQIGFGIGTTHADGDADGDMDVDGVDLAIWSAEYGLVEQPPPPLQAVPSPATASALSAQLVDLAMMAGDRTADFGFENAENIEQERASEVVRDAIAEINAAPRLVADFGDIAVSRPSEDDSSAQESSLDEELDFSSL